MLLWLKGLVAKVVVLAKAAAAKVRRLFASEPKAGATVDGKAVPVQVVSPRARAEEIRRRIERRYVLLAVAAGVGLLAVSVAELWLLVHFLGWWGLLVWSVPALLAVLVQVICPDLA